MNDIHLETDKRYSQIHCMWIIFMCLVTSLPLTSMSDISANFSYMSKTPRPPIDEQRELAIDIIADALLDPSLDAIATVQSPVYGPLRVQHSSLNGSLRDYMKAFNFDCVFVAETLYGENVLPSIINVIQEHMYSSKLWFRPPRNYRDRLFHYDDSVWLVFLKRDHVMNYKRSPATSRRTEEFINGVMAKELPADKTIEVLNLNDILTESNMFSLVEDYASILIDVPGPKLVPIFRERERIFYPMLHVPSADTEFVLPPEFLDDLSDILKALADRHAGQSMRIDDLRSDAGREVARRVLERANEDATAHLRPDWVRRDKTPSPHPELMDTVFDLQGIVRNEDGDPVPNAEVWVMPRTDIQSDHASSDNKGKFKIEAKRALPAEVRFLVVAPNYSPTVFFKTHDEISGEELELILKRGRSLRIHLDIKTDEWRGHSIENGFLLVIDPIHRIHVASFGFHIPDHGKLSQPQLWHKASEKLNLMSQEYDLIWLLSLEDDIGFYLGRRQFGDRSVERVVVDRPDTNAVLDRGSLESFLLFRD